jgi:hypothetical protein
MTKADEVELARNHKHFILVDDGSNGESRTEINFRTGLEVELSKGIKQTATLPMILIVIQGDLRTLEKVHQFIRNKIPVVIVAVSQLCLRAVVNST